MTAGTEGDVVFVRARPRLFDVAYRMTGSVADADDLCQEAWLRWQRAPRDGIDTPEAWLVRTITNLAIDRARSAQARREHYVGPYLPEPLVTGALGDPPTAAASGDPEQRAELADSLTFAFLVMLDALDPTARAVLLLHDVFGFDFDEVAAAVDKSPAACRQIASRTRRKLHSETAAPATAQRRATVEEEQAMFGRLLTALTEGDIPAVMALLAPDVVQLDDGGPARHAGRRPVVGPHRVSRLLVNITKRMDPRSELEFVRVNTSPGVVLRIDGRPDIVLLMELGGDGLIHRVWSVLNPEKLKHLR
ncbi:MAG TPA: RNA polymerase sigma factor SigJ [Acidimicrobiia bacterium]